MTALRFENIALKRAGRSILSEVTLEIASGKLTAIIGPNGAGKSSLLQIAAGLLRPDRGAVKLDGVDLTSFARQKLANRRAYLPQRASVDWPISVERVVALGLLPQLPAFGGLPDALLPAVDEALADCDVVHLRHREATSLSGGELARVMLARATIGDPDLLIVDEPTADLDPRHAIDAARRLRVRADAGRTVLMAIHDLDLALRFADQIVAVHRGRLLAAGPIATVMTEPMLTELYEMRVRIIRDDQGASVRFVD